MDLAAKIEPAEVLAHLRQLGYRDISPLQLKEFIQDLKKLIIHDHLSSSSGLLTSYSSLTLDHVSSTSESLNRAVNPKKKGPLKPNLLENGENVRGATLRIPQQRELSETSRTYTNSGNTVETDYSTVSSVTRKSSEKENMAMQKVMLKKSSELDLQEAMKPKTSFIRPWNLLGASSGSGRASRSDPVSLYHYYQTLWARHKCPGEDSHAELRWVIREKMLGQDPHLYSHNALNTGARKGGRLRM